MKWKKKTVVWILVLGILLSLVPEIRSSAGDQSTAVEEVSEPGNPGESAQMENSPMESAPGEVRNEEGTNIEIVSMGDAAGEDGKWENAPASEDDMNPERIKGDRDAEGQEEEQIEKQNEQALEVAKPAGEEKTADDGNEENAKPELISAAEDEFLYWASATTEVYAAGVSSNGNHEYKSDDFPYPLYCVSPSRWGPHHSNVVETYYCNNWVEASFSFPLTVTVDGELVDVRNIVYYYQNNRDGLNFGIGGDYYQQAHFDMAYFLNLIGKNEPEDVYDYALWNEEARGGVIGGVGEADIRGRLIEYSKRGGALIREKEDQGAETIVNMYVMKTPGTYVDDYGRRVRYQDLITYEIGYRFYSDVYLSIKKSSADRSYSPSMENISYQVIDNYGNVFMTFVLDQQGYAKKVEPSSKWTNTSYVFIGQENRIIDNRTVAAAHIRRTNTNEGIPAGALLLREVSSNENYTMTEGKTAVPAIRHKAMQLLSVDTNKNLEDKPYYSVGIYKHDEKNKPVTATFDIYGTNTKDPVDGNGMVTARSCVKLFSGKSENGYLRMDVTGYYNPKEGNVTGKYRYIFAVETATDDAHEVSVKARNLPVYKGKTIPDRECVDWVNYIHYPERGNIRLEKSETADDRPMEGVKFEIKNLKTGEAHILYTDAEGRLSTEAEAYTDRVNYYDRGAYDGLPNEVWFRRTEDGKEWNPENDRSGKPQGALPAGTYRVTELACEVNAGFQLHPPVDVEVKEGSTAVIVDRNGKFYNVPLPEIRTSAARGEAGEDGAVNGTSVKVIPAAPGQTIVDTVSYINLRADTTYTLMAELMLKEEDGSVSAFTDPEGNPVRGSRVFHTGTDYDKSEFAVSGEEVVYLENLDLSRMQGRSLVVFERLYLGEVTPEAAEEGEFETCYPDSSAEFPLCHEDAEDTDQTVYVPEIRTTAKGTDGGHELLGSAGDFSDVVEYRNLQPGTEYILRGIVMDRETGEPLLLKGEQVVGEMAFVTENAGAEEKSNLADGTAELPFILPEGAESELAGKTITVFETLYEINKGKEEEILIAVHHDLMDEGQTLTVPAIATSLTDQKTGSHTAYPEKVTLVDGVSYRNLRPGREYLMMGKLMKKENGEPLLDKDGGEISGMTAFTASETGDGEVEITFTFDAELLKLDGESVVAFEECIPSGGELPVAVHADLSDEEQTVRFEKPEPKVSPGGPEPKKQEKPEEPEKTSLVEKKPEKNVKKTETPKTGDRILLLPLVAVFLLSAAGCLVVAGLERKKKRRE